MSQVLVRGIEPEVLVKLKARAVRHGRSLEAELRDILKYAAGEDSEAVMKELTEIQQLLHGRQFSDSTEIVREDRDR
ncbi:MAG TPA: hypothetical protein VFJ58_16575 [Armatimonadota bacterium]|nr:hypothetical protein [Armatimonadota bacterium]